MQIDQLFQKPWGIHWFRRDLRIFGNEALRLNWKKNEGRVVGVFCFDPKFLARPDFSHNRFGFFLNTLEKLKFEFQSQGGDLLVVGESGTDFFPRFLDYLKLKKIPLPSSVSYGRDYEPFAKERDAKAHTIFEQQGVRMIVRRDHLLIEPEEISRDSNPRSFYQVYSPFAKRWFEKLQTPEIQERLKAQDGIEKYLRHHEAGDLANTFKMNWKGLQSKSDFPFRDSFLEFQKLNSSKVTISLPEAGFQAGFSKLQLFKNKIENYLDTRDIPDVQGTSQLSIFFKNGSLASSQAIQFLKLSHLNVRQKDGPTQWLKEVAWREFYYAILFHRPDVEGRAFLAQYQNLNWENNPVWFERWKEGTTGFPIVDAGMRELLTTGWMHNRVRMIVASFLTKDLLIDWRWGEQHFMHLLLDGDLAPNNGGWQWAASTGCDPQPYFRVFNPWLQSARFDPEGLYIRKFVPELKLCPSSALHDPDADRSSFGYPKPLVNHKEQKEKAIQMYKARV